MFISSQEITRRTIAESNSDLQVIVGLTVNYWFLVRIEGEPAGVCSMPVVIVAAKSGDDDDGPFEVDIAVETPIKGMYSLFENLTVRSLVLENIDGSDNNKSVLSKVEELDEIKNIINSANRAPVVRHLKLVKKAIPRINTR